MLISRVWFRFEQKGEKKKKKANRKVSLHFQSYECPFEMANLHLAGWN